MKRDWLVIYSDVELLVVQKIFENKTNMQIAYELDVSSKSINLKILSIFKKMGVRTGLASKNLVIYHFGTKYAQHLPAIKAFVLPPVVTKEEKREKVERIVQNENQEKIRFILEHGGAGPIHSANNAPEKYTREHLLCVNQQYLDKIYKRTFEKVEADHKIKLDLAEMHMAAPVLPFGFEQGNGISYQKIISTDFKRILLLFPKSQHKFIYSEEGKSE